MTDGMDSDLPKNLSRISYCLRKKARYHLMFGCQPVLIYTLPVKILHVNRVWAPVLDLLKPDEYITLKNIVSRVHHIKPGRIEFFLNNLVREGFLEQRGTPILEEYPFVSLIIPVKDNPELLSACLRSLKKLDYPFEKREILVVDNASSDHTPQAAARFSETVLLTFKTPQSIPACRNLGARHAKGDILAFIDANCLIHPQWLREIVPAFRDKKLGAAGGLIQAYFEIRELDHYEKVRYDLKMGSWHKQSARGDSFFYLPSCNFLVRRNVFLQMDGFAEDLPSGEDVDFCWRLQDRGFHLEYIPAGRVFHKQRNRLIPFCIRYFKYGGSEVILRQRHGTRVKEMMLPYWESLFWIFLLISVLSGSPVILVFTGLILFSDAVRQYAEIHQRKIPINFFYFMVTVIKNYLSFAYQCCGFVSRYYLLPGLLLFPLIPFISAVTGFMHLAAGLTEYWSKKPIMTQLSYLFFFTLEQFFYQLGVWWECIRRVNFTPLIPKIVSSKETEEDRRTFDSHD
jgi:mycofactocin system glycosyltransferase